MSRPISESTVKIVGGEEAIPNSITWQISMRYKSDEHAFCGGSIISPNRILTAAHCLMDESLAQPDPIYKGCYLVENMEIFAGTQTKGGKNLVNKDKYRQARKIRSFCTHPARVQIFDLIFNTCTYTCMYISFELTERMESPKNIWRRRNFNFS